MKNIGITISVFIVVLFVGSFSYGSTSQVNPADLVITGGKIITMEEKLPIAEALAIRKDTIVAVGTHEQIRQYIGNTTAVLDIKGHSAIPGFIEGHGHLLQLGKSKIELDLSEARNWDEIVLLVKKRVEQAKPGEWIIGFGWHQEKWDAPPADQIEGYPTDASLNRISPENPVLLVHASGHALFANGNARRAAGVTEATLVPAGGRMLRDAGGNPMGVFFDAAQDLIQTAYDAYMENRTPQQVEVQNRKAIALAVQECLSKGITSFQDAHSSFRDIELYKKLVDEKQLGIRLWAMINESNENLAEHLSRYRLIGYGDNRLTVRAIKKFMDGALGSRTAWLLEPYSDQPGSTGLNVDPPAEIMETAQLAIKNGFQLCVHAIGDRANRETLDIYEKYFREIEDGKSLRWRIEHAQHLSSADIPRFGQLGVIASMQAVHSTSDGPWVPKRIGTERAEEGAYVWQKLINSGAVVANGTDTPVEDVNPILNFYAAITRKLPDGNAFYPDQRMTRWQALRAYTTNNAYAAFEEQIKGSLISGKLADITILSGDLTSVPDDQIRNIEVLFTIVGGEVMYRK
jgi:predicted amidohydrolase YtcJ